MKMRNVTAAQFKGPSIFHSPSAPPLTVRPRPGTEGPGPQGEQGPGERAHVADNVLRGEADLEMVTAANRRLNHDEMLHHQGQDVAHHAGRLGVQGGVWEVGGAKGHLQAVDPPPLPSPPLPAPLSVIGIMHAPPGATPSPRRCGRSRRDHSGSPPAQASTRGWQPRRHP